MMRFAHTSSTARVTWCFSLSSRVAFPSACCRNALSSESAEVWQDRLSLCFILFYTCCCSVRINGDQLIQSENFENLKHPRSELADFHADVLLLKILQIRHKNTQSGGRD